jgi:hypothetical protein
MRMSDKIYRPHTMNGKVITSKMKGMGAGSVLLDKGGAGSGSSYYSMDDYLATTGEKRPTTKGLGLGGAIEDKLSKLKISNPKIMEAPRRKPQNINFSI